MVLLRRAISWFDRRRRLVAMVLVGWVALVMIGAGAKPAASGRFGIPNLQDAFVGVVMVGAIGGLLVLPFAFQRGDGRRQPAKPSRAFLIAAGMIVLWSIFSGPSDDAEHEAEPDQAQVVVDDEASSADADGAVPGGDIAALVLTAFAALVVLAWTHRRFGTALRNLGDEPELRHADVAPAIDRAADLLQSGSEPRVAVLKAYAVLETSLADCGFPREPAETPTEHLTRALAALPVVTGPAVRLGELYELARFSNHPITRDDQRGAAEALDRARRQLTAPAVAGP